MTCAPLPAALLAAWRAQALRVVSAEAAATPSQRACAWAFLRQWGVR